MVGGTYNFALISINGGNETAFGLGDEILAGATLHAVFPDRAILRRGGALESLELKDIAALAEGSIITSAQHRKDAPISGIRGSGTSFTVLFPTVASRSAEPSELAAQPPGELRPD